MREVSSDDLSIVSGGINSAAVHAIAMMAEGGALYSRGEHSGRRLCDAVVKSTVATSITDFVCNRIFASRDTSGGLQLSDHNHLSAACAVASSAVIGSLLSTQGTSNDASDA